MQPANVYMGNAEYFAMYGRLPTSHEELVEYAKNTIRHDPESLEKAKSKILDIDWNIRQYTFFIVPTATPRPRSGGGHFYVRGAQETKKIFQKVMRDEGLICTRVIYELDAYLPTPINSMTNEEIILAEQGLIRPIVTPDFDNLAKTYTDALQGVILLNDNLIVGGHVEKYYSLKPRINIILHWMKDFDSKYNERKTLNSIAFKKAVKGDEKNGEGDY